MTCSHVVASEPTPGADPDPVIIRPGEANKTEFLTWDQTRPTMKASSHAGFLRASFGGCGHHVGMPATGTTTSSLTVAPTGAMVTGARMYHLIVALVGTSALAISLILSATSPVNGGALNGIIFTLSYFTVWSNIIALGVNWMLAADPLRDGAMFRWLRITSLVMIVITGLIYAIILAPIANPCGWGVYTNIGFHYIVPWGTLLGFLLFGPRPRFSWDLLPKMLVIPIVWVAYTLIRGAMTVNAPGSPCDNTTLQTGVNFYPYPFINLDYDGTGGPAPLIPGLEAAGYVGVALNLLVVLLLGLAMAGAFVGLDRLLSRGAKPTPMSRSVAEGGPQVSA
jgi:hypothetical protein